MKKSLIISIIIMMFLGLSVIPASAQSEEAKLTASDDNSLNGSAAGLSATADWTAESDQAYAHLGWSVGTAGDVNGDGYDDVIVGAYRYYDNGQKDEGQAFVYSVPEPVRSLPRRRQ